MILSDDAQKKASMVMIKIGNGEAMLPAEKMGAEQDYMDDMMIEAGAEVMDAIKSDDAESFAYALKNFIMACEYSNDDY